MSPAPQYPLRLILNTHNFLGIDPCQVEHNAIQEQAGLPTDHRAVIPFNLSSYEIMTAVFDQVSALHACASPWCWNHPLAVLCYLALLDSGNFKSNIGYVKGRRGVVGGKRLLNHFYTNIFTQL